MTLKTYVEKIYKLWKKTISKKEVKIIYRAEIEIITKSKV